ncbi:hypothetical protein FRC12_016622 [Ceratobasidium sp. 428]|nr:hypothetical protein FRC12_016622 [Ceratobasidium sp. 428]
MLTDSQWSYLPLVPYPGLVTTSSEPTGIVRELLLRAADNALQTDNTRQVAHWRHGATKGGEVWNHPGLVFIYVAQHALHHIGHFSKTPQVHVEAALDR